MYIIITTWRSYRENRNVRVILSAIVLLKYILDLGLKRKLTFFPLFDILYFKLLFPAPVL